MAAYFIYDDVNAIRRQMRYEGRTGKVTFVSLDGHTFKFKDAAGEEFTVQHIHCPENLARYFEEHPGPIDLDGYIRKSSREEHWKSLDPLPGWDAMYWGRQWSSEEQYNKALPYYEQSKVIWYAFIRLAELTHPDNMEAQREYAMSRWRVYFNSLHWSHKLWIH